MPFDPGALAIDDYQWKNAPSRDTPLDESHLEGAQELILSGVRQVAKDLGDYADVHDASTAAAAAAALAAHSAATAGIHGIADTSTLALVNATQTFTQPQFIRSAASGELFEVGPGTKYGSPASAPTVALGAAGALTGAYKYVYTERDPDGETTASPASSVVNPAAQKVTVTLPLPRRGTSERHLYRTTAGGSTFFLLSDLQSGGLGYFQTQFTDNVADGALGGTSPPLADTTNQMRFHVSSNDRGVQYLRSFPGAPAAGDLTVLTGDPSGTGYSIDAYASIKCRAQPSQSTFASLITGTGLGSHHLHCDTISASNPDVTAAPAVSTVFAVQDTGTLLLTPAVDVPMLDIRPVAGAVTMVLRVLEPADTQPRFQIDPNGRVSWGPGSSDPANDVSVYRGAANLLRVTQNFSVGGNLAVNKASDSTAPAQTLDVRGSGGGTATFRLGSDSWGAFVVTANGSSPGDVVGGTSNATALRLGTNGPTVALAIDTSQNVIVGPGAKATPAELATTATAGFFYIPTVNGTPTGVPASLPTGAAPMVVDRTGNKLWFYIGGWKGIGLA